MVKRIKVVKYGPGDAGDADESCGLPVETKLFSKGTSAHAWAKKQACSPFFTVVYSSSKATAYVGGVIAE